ncbi:MAG: thioredoxin [Acetatifactor sp.]
MAERINKDSFEDKVLKSSIPVLVDFYSDSCVPCKMLSPVLGDIEEEREGQLAVYKVNVNYDSELAERYGVMGAPTLILFSQGEVKDKRTGAVKKDVLTEWIDKQLV